MGEIWVTGDIHGDATRFSKENFPEQRNFYGNQNSNVVIILGDFGLIWDWHGETKQERFWLDWLEEKNYTTVFVDGNHENFNRLYQYSEKKWNGGKVHMIRPHVLHLMRGEIYDINGKSFFAFGGASSHDISDGILDPADCKNSHELNMACREKDDFGEYMYRIKGQSWWEQELPTDQEMQHGLDNLALHNNKVDFLLSHSPGASDVVLLGKGLYKQDILTEYLEKIKQENEIGIHLFGHMHDNLRINERDILLYEQITRIV